MPTMIPPYPRANANRSEKAIFTTLEGIMDRPDWVVIHSLELAQNYGAFMGEADFVVLVPGKGILVTRRRRRISSSTRRGTGTSTRLRARPRAR